MSPRFNNADQWLKDNGQFFLPPVCNRLMHNTQLKVFYVGGPNTRKDFHIEEGEELFYMHQGNMCLKVFTNNKFQDVIIREGEIFLLPARIPHSPQRRANTIGLVIERERLVEEKDCIRYYVNGSTDILYEKWFYCEELGTQIGPIINEFFNSEQHRTGKPIPGTITNTPPYQPDKTRKLELPMNLQQWLESNKEEINENKWKRLYGTNYETDVIVYGKGNHYRHSEGAETFIWLLKGSTSVNVENSTQLLSTVNDTFLIPSNSRYTLSVGADSLCMAVTMDSKNKWRAKSN